MKTIFDLSSGEIVYYLRFKNGEYRSVLIGILLASPDQYSVLSKQNKSKSILKWLFKMDIFHIIIIFHVFQLLKL